MLGQIERCDPRSKVFVDHATIRTALGQATFDFGLETVTLAHECFVLSIKRAVASESVLEQVKVVDIHILVVIVAKVVIIPLSMNLGRAGETERVPTS